MCKNGRMYQTLRSSLSKQLEIQAPKKRRLSGTRCFGDINSLNHNIYLQSPIFTTVIFNPQEPCFIEPRWVSGKEKCKVFICVYMGQEVNSLQQITIFSNPELIKKQFYSSYSDVCSVYLSSQNQNIFLILPP